MSKLVLALILSTAVLTTSCSATADIKAAGKIFVDCSKANIGEVISADGMTSLFQVVLTIVMAGGEGWQAALESIGKTFGQNELACAVVAVESFLVAHADGSPATAALSPQAARALSFLASHQEWSFVAPSAK